eukprot:8678523-Pyramimonas_sp.AAC.1
MTLPPGDNSGRGPSAAVSVLAVNSFKGVEPTGVIMSPVAAQNLEINSPNQTRAKNVVAATPSVFM